MLAKIDNPEKYPYNIDRWHFRFVFSMIKQRESGIQCTKNTTKYRFWPPLKYRFLEYSTEHRFFYLKYWTRSAHTEWLASLLYAIDHPFTSTEV